MTEIGFHYNARDKLTYACRLVRKAVNTRGLRVVVVGDARSLDAVDAALWQLSPVDFVAHCRDDAPAMSSRARPWCCRRKAPARPRCRIARCW